MHRRDLVAYLERCRMQHSWLIHKIEIKGLLHAIAAKHRQTIDRSAAKIVCLGDLIEVRFNFAATGKTVQLDTTLFLQSIETDLVMRLV